MDQPLLTTKLRDYLQEHKNAHMKNHKGKLNCIGMPQVLYNYGELYVMITAHELKTYISLCM